MSWENIGTWLDYLDSIATIVGVLFGLWLQMNAGVSFGRENHFRSMLMSHKKVYKLYYENVFKVMAKRLFLETRLERTFLAIFGILWAFFVVVFSKYYGIEYSMAISVWLSSFFELGFMFLAVIIISVVRKIRGISVIDASWRFISNIALPFFVLSLFLLVPLSPESSPCGNIEQSASFNVSANLTTDDIFMIFKNNTGWVYIAPVSSEPLCYVALSTSLNSSCNFTVCNSTSFLTKPVKQSPITLAGSGITAYILEILLLLAFSKIPLMAEKRWGSILHEDTIKGAVSGLMWILILSGLSTVLWVHVWPYPEQRYMPFVIGLLGFLALVFIVNNVRTTAIRLLWKVKAQEFSGKLPHLIVKTKTGNIYYGQLYDPLDSKVLVLRKSRLMHGGQIVEDKNELIPRSLWENEGDYWIIPWNDIESIKIVEEGLYAP